MPELYNSPSGSSSSTPFSSSPLGVIMGLASAPITAAINGAYGSKAAAEAYERQLDFWDKQNEYNDPSNARERLEKAGFNPMAAIQGIAQSQAAGGLSSVAMNPAAGQIMSNPLEGLQTLAQVDEMRSHSSLLVQQAAKQYLENLVEKWNLPADIKKAIFRYIHSDRINEAEISNVEADTENKEASAGHHVSSARHEDALADTEDALREKRVAELDARIEEINSNVSVNATRQSLMGSQIELNDALKDLTVAQTATEKERALNVVADTALKRAQAVLTSYEGALAELEVEWSRSGQREFTVFGHTFKIGRSNYEKLRDAALSTGRYNARQAGIIASTLEDTIELQQVESRMRAYVSEMQGNTIKHDDSWWNRTLEQIHETARDVASFLPFRNPAPTRVRGFSAYQ